MDGKLLTIVKVTVFVLLLLTSSTLVLTNEVKVTALSGPEFDYQYINGDAEVEITGYHGTDGQVSIPSSIDGKPVTSIADYSFSYLSTINSIQIPGSITNIGLYSFYSCPSLLSFEVDSSNPSYASVDGVLYDKAITTLYLCPTGRSEALTIPETVTTIGPSSCSDCLKLKEVSIPTSVTTIGDYSFYRNTALAVLTIPEGIVYIGYSSFEQCNSLIDVSIPSSVTSLQSNAFASCSSLMAINTSTANPNYASVDGILYDKGMTQLLQCPAGKMGSITVEQSVTKISSYAFSKCTKLTGVSLPEGLINIGSSAFTYCTSLTSVTLPNNLSEIGANAFSYCSALTTIIIPENVSSIGKNAFYQCTALTNIEVGPGNPAYASEEGILYDKNITKLLQCPNGFAGELSIPASVVAIDSRAFYQCEGLVAVTIPSNVTSIGSNAFYRCTGLRSIIILGGMTSIEDSVFYRCNALTSITLPDTLSSIGNYSFYQCSSLRSISIPDSVITIGNYAFTYCSNLATLELPQALTSMGNYSFSSCSSLRLISIPGDVTYMSPNAFSQCNSLTSFDVDDSNANYASVDGLLYDKAMTSLMQCPAGKTGVVTVPEGVLTIEEYAFYYCTYLISINIPDSVSEIGDYAFYSCTSLLSINIPDGILVIGDYTFYQCESLITIHIPNSVSRIGDYAFTSCRSLVSVLMPSGLSFIGNETFRYCSSMTMFSIPGSVGYIGASAFASCSSLSLFYVDPSNLQYSSEDGLLYDGSKTTVISCPPLKAGTVVLPDGVTQIASSAFESCNLLTSIAIPEGVTAIGDNAFYYCESLTSISLPTSLQSIGQYAFYGCRGLSNMAIPANVVQIGDYAFWYMDSMTAIDVEGSNPVYASVDGILYEKGLVTLIQCPMGKVGEVGLPETVAKVGDYAFNGCSLVTRVVLVDGVASIGASAFSDSGITTISIPEATIEIGDSAFRNCYALGSINVEASNPIYSSHDGVLYDKARNTLIQCPSAKEGTLTIPEGVQVIAPYALYECSGLVSILFPESLTTIGSNALYRCSSLTNLTIPSEVISIGNYAFRYCESLDNIEVHPSNPAYSSWNGILFDKTRSILIQCPSTKQGDLTLPGGIETIGSYAFHQCTGLRSITLPEGVIVIDNYAFYECSSVTTISLPGSVSSIGNYAFYRCSSLTEVVVPDNVTNIGNRAFSYCDKLTSIELPSKMTHLGDGAFSFCAGMVSIEVDPSNSNYASQDGILYDKELMTLLQCPAAKQGNVTVPGTVLIISASAFYYCTGLREVNISEGLIAIGDYAFYQCGSLMAVDLPEGLIVIGDSAFAGCGSVQSLTIPGGVISIGASAFSSCYDLTSLTIAEGVENIGPSAFWACSSLTNVTIPSSVLSIGTSAFGYCEAMMNITVAAMNPTYADVGGILYDKELTWLIQCPGAKDGAVAVPDGVLSIEDEAFYFCSHLTSVALPGSLTSIGDYSFYGCYALTNLSLPEHVESIGAYAFGSCSSLLNISIPADVQYIGVGALNYCSSLTSIDVDPANLRYTSIDGVLYDHELTTLIQCPAAKGGEVDIPGSVVRIEDQAFYSCGALTNASLPTGLVEIGDNAFSYCYLLTNVTLPEGLKSVGYYAFYYCSQLDSMNVPSSLTTIEDSAFEGCSAMKNIVVDPANPNYASIDGLLYDKALTSLIQCPGGKEGAIVLPDSIISIEDRALYQCSRVTSVTIPNGLEYIGRNAFYRCAELQLIYIPYSVSQIGNQAFSACPSLKEIEVDVANPFYASFDGVLYDKSMSALIQCPAGRGGAFSVPDGVTSIQDYAFYECNLTSLIVPSSVVTIKYRGFDYMMSLTQIYFLGDAPQCDDYWIHDWNESLKIFYSQGRSGFTSPTWYGIETVALVSIVGKVVDNEGSGIPGVKVTLDDNLWVITGIDGNFTILTSVGDHNLTFSGSGLKNRTMDIDVSESGLVLEDVEMDTIGDDYDGDSNNTWLIAAVAGIIAVAVGSIGYLWWRKNKK